MPCVFLMGQDTEVVKAWEVVTVPSSSQSALTFVPPPHPCFCLEAEMHKGSTHMHPQGQKSWLLAAVAGSYLHKRPLPTGMDETLGKTGSSPLTHRAVSLREEQYSPDSRDTWQCLKTFFGFSNGGEVATSKPGMLLISYHVEDSPPKRKNFPAPNVRGATVEESSLQALSWESPPSGLCLCPILGSSRHTSRLSQQKTMPWLRPASPRHQGPSLTFSAPPYC